MEVELFSRYFKRDILNPLMQYYKCKASKVGKSNLLNCLIYEYCKKIQLTKNVQQLFSIKFIVQTVHEEIFLPHNITLMCCTIKRGRWASNQQKLFDFMDQDNDFTFFMDQLKKAIQHYTLHKNHSRLRNIANCFYLMLF